MDQPRSRRAEPAGVKVERGELCVEVDVQPLASRGPSVKYRPTDHLGSNALMLKAPPGLRVHEEGVVAAVPGHVHEADELSVDVPGGYPTEAVAPDLVPPAGDGTPP